MKDQVPLSARYVLPSWLIGVGFTAGLAMLRGGGGRVIANSNCFVASGIIHGGVDGVCFA